MSQDITAGFGTQYMPKGCSEFGAASITVDGFDNTTIMNEPLSSLSSGYSESQSFQTSSVTSNYDSFAPTIQTPHVSTDCVIREAPSPLRTSSPSQGEGREHEYYQRGTGPDGMYHCPFEGCKFPPKNLKCEYRKHIDSHLRPFRCRKPDCANQAFSSVACVLRHEREMHKMHNAEEYLCRHHGRCDRKQPGNGFTRSFNRGDHERRVHSMVQGNTRSHSRTKSRATVANNAHPAVRRNNATCGRNEPDSFHENFKSAVALDLISESDGNDDNGLFPWTSSFETDSEPLRDSFLELEPLKLALVQRLLEKFQAQSKDIRSHGSSGDKKYQNSKPDGNSTGFKESGSCSNSKGRSLKRRRRGKSPADEDSRRVRPRIATDNSEHNLFLACPFYKHSPQKYRHCSKFLFVEISRLKQHLEISHKISIHCARCLLVFETEEARDCHLRKVDCKVLPPRDWEGINENQKKQLERRVSSRNTREENWFIVYEILFPDASRPKSPYVDPSFAEGLCALREFAAREGPALIREHLSRGPPEFADHFGFDDQAFAVTLFPTAFDLIVNSFESQRPWESLPGSSQERLSSFTSSGSGYNGSTGGALVDTRVGGSASEPLPFYLEAVDEFPTYFLECDLNGIFDNPQWKF